MAHWILYCPGCMSEITHSEIGEPHGLEDLVLWPLKPNIPDSGATLGCPSCLKDFVFRRHNLTYRAA